MRDDRTIGLLAADLAGGLGQIGEPLSRNVRFDSAGDRLQQAEWVVEKASIGDRVTDPGNDLLLASRSREVALSGGSPDTGVGQRLPAVEMVTAGGDREAALIAILAVLGVAEATCDVDVDASERVHDADEAPEIHLGVVGDRLLQEGAKGVHQDVETLAVGPRELAGVMTCI